MCCVRGQILDDRKLFSLIEQYIRNEFIKQFNLSHLKAIIYIRL